MSLLRPVAIAAGLLMLGESAAAQLQPSPSADAPSAGKDRRTVEL